MLWTCLERLLKEAYADFSHVALIEHGVTPPNEDLLQRLARKYIECMKDMNGRAPGK